MYSCPLSNGECSALASNDTEEGRYLFDSLGKWWDSQDLDQILPKVTRRKFAIFTSFY